MDELTRRIGEAAWWASSPVDGPYRTIRTGPVLRSNELRPHDLMMDGSLAAGLAPRAIADARHGVVETLVARRRALSPRAVAGADGRLLSFIVEGCFSDRVAETETEGFFDENDLPPWDTWVAFIRESGTLVSWAPPSFVATVEKAIRTHLVDAYAWLTDDAIAELRVALDRASLAP